VKGSFSSSSNVDTARVVTNLTQIHNLNNKLDQLEKINRLKDVYSEDSTYMVELLFIEKEIIARGHYLDLFKRNNEETVLLKTKTEYIASNIIKDIILEDSCNISETTIDNIIKQKETINNPPRAVSRKSSISNKDIRNVYWMIISSAITFILFGIWSILSIKTEGFNQGFSGLIVACTFVWFFTFLSYKIPIISETNLKLNYIINFVAHMVIIIMTIRVIDKST